MTDETTTEKVELEETDSVEIVTTELYNRMQARKIVNLLSEGHTYNQIAQELGVHRNTLYAIISQEDMRPLLVAEITSQETEAQRMIKELDESKNSANKRHALSELTKMIRHNKDKIYPTIFRTENLHASVTTNEFKETALLMEQVLYESIRRLPPDTRKAWSRHWEDIKREWNITRNLMLS